MLTPEYLQRLPDSVVELYAQAEADILADMARRINGFDLFIPSAQYQMERLEEMGALRRDIISKLSGLTGKSRKEIAAIMQEAGVETLSADEKIYQAAGLVGKSELSPAVQEVLNAGLQKTGGLFRNLTKTTANTATRQFENALDRAYLQVTSGAFDPNTAVRSAIKSLAQQGVGAITYPSGHVDTLEVAVRRALVTGVNQTCLQMQEARADELGCDLVETTAHSGARPSHAEWQGQVFSRSGKSRKYPDFVQVTGYGTGEGLGGWNCSHSFYPFFEGLPRTYSDKLLDSYKAKDYEYNGKKMTEYEALQTQRGIERKLRRWKRENIAMKAAGQDTTESAVKIAQWQTVQKDFLSQTGLKRQRDREQIAGWSRKAAAQASGSARSAQHKANRYFSLSGPEENLREYLKEKPIIDLLEQQGVEYKQRISEKEIIVSAGVPKIVSESAHAVENRAVKTDRADMTAERAQSFVDSAKLTLYQPERQTLKFMAENGYAVLNFDHKLVTAVPQKWRKKYDDYLEENQ